jgi:hypothetical protein
MKLLFVGGSGDELVLEQDVRGLDEHNGDTRVAFAVLVCVLHVVDEGERHLLSVSHLRYPFLIRIAV